jgi:glycosyltransferase involved in cell wall biosynthesis
VTSAPDEDRPKLTIVIPTRNRPVLLEGAVDSALAQTLADVEVVVVDDASEPPVALAPQPGLRTIRNATPRGLSGARNVGLEAARGLFVTFLDDDDRLTPHMAAVSLDALRATSFPPPVAVLSGVEVVRGGRVVERRIPPTYPRGRRFPLEQPPPGRSHMTKHTLVVETDLLRALGGFDEDLSTRELSDVLLRLNAVCTIVGLTTTTYRLSRERGPHVSRDTALLEDGVERFLRKHRDLIEAHPQGHADVLLGHARMSIVAGPRRAVLPSVVRAFRVAPRHTATVLLNPLRMARALLTLRSSG